MRRRQIAVCDREPEYALRFAEYANQREEPLFLVHGFESLQALQEYRREHAVDVLLLDTAYADVISQGEEPGQVYLLGDEEFQNGTEAYPVIWKLQSCGAILSRVMELYAQQPESLGQFLRMTQMKRLGVYSPIGRLGKTSFALALGKELAKRKRTLYLNLEEYSGFEQLYPYGDGWTLSELMYFLKQGKNAFTCKLESVIQQIGGLDYIPPLKSPVELRQIGLEDWQSLLEALERESRYEIVILDLSGAVNGLYELLAGCDAVYTLLEEEETACAKMSQYEETLRLLELEEILERTQRVQFPSELERERFIRKEKERWTDS